MRRLGHFLMDNRNVALLESASCHAGAPARSAFQLITQGSE